MGPVSPRRTSLRRTASLAPPMQSCCPRTGNCWPPRPDYCLSRRTFVRWKAPFAGSSFLANPPRGPQWTRYADTLADLGQRLHSTKTMLALVRVDAIVGFGVGSGHNVPKAYAGANFCRTRANHCATCTVNATFQRSVETEPPRPAPQARAPSDTGAYIVPGTCGRATPRDG